MKKESLPAYLAAHSKTEKASFHMPGHKGAAFFARLGVADMIGGAGSDDSAKNVSGMDSFGTADFDITEIPGADDLRRPSGVIKAISDNYSELYGSTRSFISVNGSSALIMAAIMTAVKPGRRIIAASDSHISVRNGISFAGADVVYPDPEMLDPDIAFASDLCTASEQDSAAEQANGKDAYAAPCQIFGGEIPGIPGGLDAVKTAALLDEYEDADAVILPSPNYFGVVSDIRAIAEEVHKRGRILIVDQAHGAHLKMMAEREQDAVAAAEDCGADIVIDSTHKTLASFTQTAVANLFGDRVDPDAYEQALLKFESTSPSYVLMDSLAVNADIMKERGSALAGEWRDDLKYFYEEVKSIHGVRVMTRGSVRAAGGADFDETKIVLDFSRAGMSGEEAEEALIEQGVYPEFHSGSIVMCLTGIGNTRKDYDILLEALRSVSNKAAAEKE